MWSFRSSEHRNHRRLRLVRRLRFGCSSGATAASTSETRCGDLGRRPVLPEAPIAVVRMLRITIRHAARGIPPATAAEHPPLLRSVARAPHEEIDAALADVARLSLCKSFLLRRSSTPGPALRLLGLASRHAQSAAVSCDLITAVAPASSSKRTVAAGRVSLHLRLLLLILLLTLRPRFLRTPRPPLHLLLTSPPWLLLLLTPYTFHVLLTPPSATTLLNCAAFAGPELLGAAAAFATELPRHHDRCSGTCGPGTTGTSFAAPTTGPNFPPFRLATVAACEDLIPALFPLLPPREGPVADHTFLHWQVVWVPEGCARHPPSGTPPNSTESHSGDSQSTILCRPAPGHGGGDRRQKRGRSAHPTPVASAK
mmetsp:Transcript_7504/g.16315  ORF Transcript_7504/g.16315 Transcript_7504/m.16315 type:complete len:369 (-) Transcript_7504:71-1177(-)